MSKLPLLMVSDGLTLRPHDAYSAEMLDKLPRGPALNVTASIATSRSGDLARDLLAVWWAGIKELFDNSDNKGPDGKALWVTPAGLSDYILTEIGFGVTIPDGKGGVTTLPRSLKLIDLDDVDERLLVLEAAKAHVIAWKGWDPWQESRDKWEMKRHARHR